ncbi:response regulator transcription factor [Cellulomonas sp. HZM]|uniref:response regulator n=1 Tax=Cellulomonas sp. HZM TaxID=1454010 RepID=UPI0004936BFB|nr:response regulator transcription factor [Cellulomonas sp. HZM]
MTGSTDGRPVAAVRVLVVDDDPLVRAGLRLMLDGARGGALAVVGEAADGAQVAAALDEHRADVVLMDLRMPGVGGIAATRAVRRRPDPPAVVVLTTFDTADEVAGALHAGASGYLLKDAPPDQVAAAVLAAAVGEPVLAPSVARRLMDDTARAAADRSRAREALGALTPRERDVVLAVARGLSNDEVGRELFLAPATVKAHVSSALLKLGLDNRTRLALLVHAAGGAEGA